MSMIASANEVRESRQSPASISVRGYCIVTDMTCLPSGARLGSMSEGMIAWRKGRAETRLIFHVVVGLLEVVEIGTDLNDPR